MSGSLSPRFSDFFFGWLANNTDPQSGYVCASEVTKSTAPKGGKPSIGWMTCFAHLSWQYVFANQTWPFAAAQVDSGLSMQNTSTGWFCSSPAGGGQCESRCLGCTENGCCGSASPVMPSCHQLDGIWTVTRSSALAGGYRLPDVALMCRRFLHSAARVMTNASIIGVGDHLPYGDSHGFDSHCRHCRTATNNGNSAGGIAE